MRTIRRSSLVLTALIALLVLTAVPAAARTESSLDRFDDTVTEEFCGLPLEIHSSGTFSFRVFFDRNDDFVKVVAKVNGEIILTNPATGLSAKDQFVTVFTIFPDVDNGDGTKTGKVQQKGTLTRLKGPTGKVLLSSHGRLNTINTVRVDENGEFVAVVSSEILYQRGTFPETDDVDALYCEKLVPAIAPA